MSWSRWRIQHGLQCVCHAIGDAAIEMMLDEFEKVNQETPDNPLRHGIVHCQITDEALHPTLCFNPYRGLSSADLSAL